MYSALVTRSSLGADAENLFIRIMKISISRKEHYKSILSAILENEKTLRYYGVRRKVGTAAEGFAGREVLLIDSRSKWITDDLGMKGSDVLKVLKHHKHYLGTRKAGLGGVSVSCMYFDIKALEGVTAPDVVASVQEVTHESDDDDVKFGE